MAPAVDNLFGFARELDVALLFQKGESGHKLVVRNTFLQVDEDAPAAEGLQRAVTAPPLLFYGVNEGTVEATTADNENEGAVLSPAALSRLNTNDHFETGNDCLPLHWTHMPTAAPLDTSAEPSLPAGFGKALGPSSIPWGGDEPEAFSIGSQWLSARQLDLTESLLSDGRSVAPMHGGFTHLQFDSQQIQKLEQYTDPRSAMLPPLLQPEAQPVMQQEWEPLGKAPEPFQRHTLNRYRNRRTGDTRIEWIVDGRKLRSNDRNAVSPGFELAVGQTNAQPRPFKMIITPNVSSDGRGGSSFRRAKGCGSVQLKCEAPPEEVGNLPVSFHLSAGNGRHDKPNLQGPRGPVIHNFAQSGVSGLTKKTSDDIWDFLSVLDKDSDTFVVQLDILRT